MKDKAWKAWGYHYRLLKDLSFGIVLRAARPDNRDRQYELTLRFARHIWTLNLYIRTKQVCLTKLGCPAKPVTM